MKNRLQVCSGDDYTVAQVERYYPDLQDRYVQFPYTKTVSSTEVKERVLLQALEVAEADRESTADGDAENEVLGC